MKTVAKIEKLIEKAEGKKQKLVNRIGVLKEEVEALYQVQQDDFNESILNDRDPSKKITSDLEKVREELKQKQYQLSQVDIVVQKEVEKAKSEVDKERNQFVKDKGEEFRKQFDKMNQAKINYLETIVEYSKMESDYKREYRMTFQEIEKRVGLRNRDPYYDFYISLNQRHQIQDRYNPMVYNDELGEALKGRLSPVAVKNKDKYKKVIHSLINCN